MVSITIDECVGHTYVTIGGAAEAVSCIQAVAPHLVQDLGIGSSVSIILGRLHLRLTTAQLLRAGTTPAASPPTDDPPPSGDLSSAEAEGGPSTERSPSHCLHVAGVPDE